MNAIPNNVTRFVQAHLQSLQELRQPFDSVFALERCSGALKVISETGHKTISSAGCALPRLEPFPRAKDKGRSRLRVNRQAGVKPILDE